MISGVAGSSFDECREIADNTLARNSKRAVILMDSLDDYYSIDTKRVIFVLKGLFKCVGEFNKAGRLFDVRLCLPAELQRIFQRYRPIPPRILVIVWSCNGRPKS